MEPDTPSTPATGRALPPLRRPRSWLRALSVAVLIAVLAGFAFLGGAVASGAWGLLGLFREQGRTEAVSRPTPSVVVAIRELARLETVTFHIERVIDRADEQPVLWGALKRKDAILLVAAADVTAGIDLGKLTDADVRTSEDGRSIRLTLPEPEVLATVLDNQRTYVHTRSTDILARRSEQLEADARLEAEATLRDAALASGLLERARRSAEGSLGGLLRAMGFEDVRITWR